MEFLTPQQFLLHFYAPILFKLHKDWNEIKINPVRKISKKVHSLIFERKIREFFGISRVKYGEFRGKFWNLENPPVFGF